jgi:hypothetical protein
VERANGKGVKVTDITKEDDVTCVGTVKDVIRQIEGPGDVLCIAHRALGLRRGNN